MAQGLQPAAPTQEFIYFGGRLIAVEERGPGGNGSNAVKAPAKAGVKAADSAPVTSGGIAPPPQPPQPVVPPQDSTGSAGQLQNTPVITHAASPAPQ